ncbi:MAG: hypothetical protein AAGA02_14455 [Bacteroidota bacterium]
MKTGLPNEMPGLRSSRSLASIGLGTRLKRSAKGNTTRALRVLGEENNAIKGNTLSKLALTSPKAMLMKLMNKIIS